MKANPKLATLISCVMVMGLAVAQGSSDRRKLGDKRSVALPSYAILDENAQPVVASSGKVGFVSSVTAGSLISFSLSSGKMLSSVVVGQTAGPVNLVESAGRRLVAVAAVNSPKEGHPATVSIIDATNAAQLDLKSLLVLPPEAQITQTTRALLTRDGKFCLIASSFDQAALFLFDVETGEMRSRLLLLERPSELALFEKGRSRVVAVTSAVANSLSVISIHDDGELMLTCMFSPSGARLDEYNNPAFSADGRTVYIASSEGDRLFAVDARSGAEFASVLIAAPQRLIVARSAAGEEIVGVTRIRRPVNGKPGGVTLISSSGGKLAVKAEFTPPEGIEFSKGNNLVFDGDASAAFIGSDTGILFAFSTETGELESYQQLGRGLHRIALSEKARRLAAVCSTSTGDEIVIVGFDVVTPEEPDPSAPTITALKPDTVEQGRLSSLHLVVKGTNFGEGSSLKVNGVEVSANLLKDGTALGAKLRRALFDSAGDLSIQVKASNGALSAPVPLHVLRPSDPMISEIRPQEVPGPASAFVLRVSGEKFRDSSVISVGDRQLDTEHRSPTELRAQVPADLVSSIGKVKVQITDMRLDDLKSNETDLTVFGPRITELTPLADAVAGDGGFNLRIGGANFRNGATVQINGNQVPEGRVRRNGSKALKVWVPSRLTEDAGKLAVVVRNPEGNASEPGELELFAPAISSFDPGQVLAGLSNVKIAVLGSNFRKGARVYVAGVGSDFARKLERRQVHFRSQGRIIVTFDDDLNTLIAQKGVVEFQVVNPNRTDGVPGVATNLEVVGPEVTEALIKPVKGDDSHVQLQITGANFRDKAVVEFFNEEDVLLRLRVPEKIRDDRIVIVYRKNKVEGLLNQKLRVVNPGDVKSDAVPLKVANDTP